MKKVNKITGVEWDNQLMPFGMRGGTLKLPSGDLCSVVAGWNEGGWEHVSISLIYTKRLPTWDEMCYVKDLFWESDEEVVQIHPKKSEYVNIMEALHLWRPKDGDWSLMNHSEIIGNS